MSNRDYDCITKIKNLRKEAKMTQLQFCEYFEIPRRTLENWEMGIRTAPIYLLNLIEYKLKKENLI